MIFGKRFIVESVNDATIKAGKNLFRNPSKTRSFETGETFAES